MVWETIGYNQPPHLSYFLGELEGITVAPPPLTTEGRTQIANGGNITTAHNGSQVLVFDNADTQVAVESGAEPWVAVFNVPSWVKGTAPSDCTTKDVPIDYEMCIRDRDDVFWQKGSYMERGGFITIMLKRHCQDYKDGNSQYFIENDVDVYKRQGCKYA